MSDVAGGLVEEVPHEQKHGREEKQLAQEAPTSSVFLEWKEGQ